MPCATSQNLHFCIIYQTFRTTIKIKPPIKSHCDRALGNLILKHSTILNTKGKKLMIHSREKFTQEKKQNIKTDVTSYASMLPQNYPKYFI